jgi:hypothetical protein
MVLVGHQSNPWFKYSKIWFRRLWNSNSSFSFWWSMTPPGTGATEEYDGTSWTSSPKFKYSKKNLGGAGTQTAALAFGGQTVPPTLQVQQNYTMESSLDNKLLQV